MKQWVNEDRRNLLCVDSYDNGVLTGRVYGALFGEIRFSSLSQFIIQMEEVFEANQMPQSYTELRRFTETPVLYMGSENFTRKKGALATFEVSILFRQNTSWQGMLKWKESRKEQTFRSALEFIILLDSALRQDV